MIVSFCEVLINFRGRWFGGDRGFWFCIDEDYGFVLCGYEGTFQIFLLVIKVIWFFSVVFGKEKKRSFLRKEISYVLYVWYEIKTGYNEEENSRFFMLFRWLSRVVGLAVTILVVVSGRGRVFGIGVEVIVEGFQFCYLNWI